MEIDMERNMNWKKCSDELPEKWKRVLVYTDRKTDPIMIGRRGGDGNWYFESHKDKDGAELPISRNSIIAWAELPGGELK